MIMMIQSETTGRGETKVEPIKTAAFSGDVDYGKEAADIMLMQLRRLADLAGKPGMYVDDVIALSGQMDEIAETLMCYDEYANGGVSDGE